MRRRTLFKRAAVVSLSLIPGAWTRSRDSEPEPAASYVYVCIGDVPAGATVAPIDEYELDDHALNPLEDAAEDMDEPGDYTAEGWILLENPEPLDYIPLPYSRPSNAPNGYYVDVGEKVVLITSFDQHDQYPEFTE